MERRTSDDKRRRTLRTAAAEIARNGFRSTSIRDIGRASGASTSGLHYYVGGREELLFPLRDRRSGTVPYSPERRPAGESDRVGPAPARGRERRTRSRTDRRNGWPARSRAAAGAPETWIGTAELFTEHGGGDGSH
jgi:AcrR family transcriptional regulator